MFIGNTDFSVPMNAISQIKNRFNKFYLVHPVFIACHRAEHQPSWWRKLFQTQLETQKMHLVFVHIGRSEPFMYQYISIGNVAEFSVIPRRWEWNSYILCLPKIYYDTYSYYKYQYYNVTTWLYILSTVA